MIVRSNYGDALVPFCRNGPSCLARSSLSPCYFDFDGVAIEVIHNGMVETKRYCLIRNHAGRDKTHFTHIFEGINIK